MIFMRHTPCWKIAGQRQWTDEIEGKVVTADAQADKEIELVLLEPIREKLYTKNNTLYKFNRFYHYTRQIRMDAFFPSFHGPMKPSFSEIHPDILTDAEHFWWQ